MRNTSAARVRNIAGAAVTAAISASAIISAAVVSTSGINYRRIVQIFIDAATAATTAATVTTGEHASHRGKSAQHDCTNKVRPSHHLESPKL
jgi:hypothetical protein